MVVCSGRVIASPSTISPCGSGGSSVDESLLRPAEVDLLVGDNSRARQVLGWEPRVGFHEMVERMVAADLERLG